MPIFKSKDGRLTYIKQNGHYNVYEMDCRPKILRKFSL
jgi:hypothetical protein